jgi:hypothetical protein
MIPIFGKRSPELAEQRQVRLQLMARIEERIPLKSASTLLRPDL